MSETSQSLGVLILGAGRGAQMRSERPKVLQNLLEEPILYYPIKAAVDAGMRNIAVLVGYRGDLVEAYLNKEWPHVEFIWQREQLGTGHAVKVAEDWWKRFEHVLVLSGDVPLVEPETLSRLVSKHRKERNLCTFLSFTVDDPSGYGRVVRLADGGFQIVEHCDADEDELTIQEINAGVYVFDTRALFEVIDRLDRENGQGEYYLTDTVDMIGDTEGDVNVVVCDDPHELLGVNTPNDLSVTASMLNRRIVRRHMDEGLKCMDPRTTWIGPRVELEPDVVLEPGVQIWGRSRIAAGARIGAYSTLRNVVVGPEATIHGPSVLSDSEVGARAEVGPFACLRCDAVLKEGAKAGRFVEVKKSVLEAGAKAPHLSYLGDAHVGEGTNIGAGTVTCNYDGRRKHRTEIGANCFVGSDTMFVAPVKMGDNASTAAGSVVTKDVPDGALAIARARQTNIDDWHDRMAVLDKSAKSDEEK